MKRLTDAPLSMVRAGLGLVLLALLFYVVPVGDLLASVVKLTLPALLLTLLLSGVSFGLSVLKLFRTVRHYRVPAPFGEVIRIYLTGSFFNNFLPTSIGGDVVKISEITRIGNTDSLTASTCVVLERVTGILALAGIGLAFLAVTPGRYLRLGLDTLTVGRSWFLPAFLIVGLIALGAYGFRERFPGLMSALIEWIGRGRRELATALESGSLLPLLLLLSGLVHAARAGVIVVLVRDLGGRMAFLDALFLLPPVALVSFLPISPGGLGVREGMMTFCLTALGVPVGDALTISLVFRLFTLLYSAAGGVLYLLPKESPPTASA